MTAIQQSATAVLTTIKLDKMALTTGLFVLACYLALIPFVDRTWRTTGDEPHYLLAAHSLVYDQDFDLTNNYAQADYLNFYFSRDIVSQVRFNEQGQQILDHQLGLPLLIAPAYALAGRLGVLLFQALLGGLLAVITFQLARLISQDERAALLATLLMMLTPPLVGYPFLIYPELIAALVVTYLVLLLIRADQPSQANIIAMSLILLGLPWLNRRFVPLALVLALLVAWYWRDRARRLPVGLLNSPAILALGAVVLSTGLLLAFNSQLVAPTRTDFEVPLTLGAVGLRLLRSVGWLVDQQRGLFIYGPIYIAALFGLPWLDWRQRHGLVLIPFVVSLGVITLAGGFWVAWELGPRFLVVALPAMTPLLALAWRQYGQRWAGRLVLGLLVLISLTNTVVLLQNSELPYKSSLPLFYGEKLSLPLVEILPDMAEQTTIVPSHENARSAQLLDTEQGPTWSAEAGRSVSMLQTEPLDELPFGHYVLRWPLQIDPGLAPDTPLLRLSFNLLGGQPIFNQVVTAADLETEQGEQVLRMAFLNTNIDRWRTPLLLQVTSTGTSNIRAKPLEIYPSRWHAWGLAYGYLALLILGAVLVWRWSFRSPDTPRLRECHFSDLFGTSSLAVSVMVLGAALGYLYWQQAQSSRTYDANEFFHFAGRLIADPTAADQQAWLVDPLIDPPQKAIYGPFDFYDPGIYQVAFRVKLVDPTETAREVARLRVNATANFEELLSQPLLASNFSEAGKYHLFVLTVDNPRRQALSFEVDYTAEAALVIDDVTITAQK